ncbi:hypothetical protein [Polaribacter sp. R77954]|uniref:hypothetical protein n=1 Tax=Polaribacter sp. R77954 TaxID=3093870 RepID=UPI0037C7D717
MGTVKKDLLIGILISLFATAAGCYLYIEYFSRFSFNETLKMIDDGDLYGKILSIAAIPNLFVFWVYIKKKQDHRAKGVLITTIVIALITLILKFI